MKHFDADMQRFCATCLALALYFQVVDELIS